jgi:hypothetical protein
MSKLSPKMLLHRANTSKSAIGFFQSYRDYMLTGELKDQLSPIVSQVDAGQAMPSMVLPKVADLILAHIVLQSAKPKPSSAKASKTVEPAKDGVSVASDESEACSPNSGPAIAKDWIVKIVDSLGEVQTRVNAKGKIEELDKSFERASDADNWAVRRLLEQSSDCHAEMTHSIMPISTLMTRQDALAIALKSKRGPSYHQKKMTTNRLGFQMTCKQDHARFSHG